MPSPMKGVEESLQAVASLHLTAIENYQSQAEHYRRWGYPRLGDYFAAEADEEREHLRVVLARLEFFDIRPSFKHEEPSWPRHDLEGALANNLDLELLSARAERAGIAACRAAGDEGTAMILAGILAGTEKAILEIEGIVKVIEQIGLDNYLANKA